MAAVDDIDIDNFRISNIKIGSITEICDFLKAQSITAKSSRYKFFENKFISGHNLITMFEMKRMETDNDVENLKTFCSWFKQQASSHEYGKLLRITTSINEIEIYSWIHPRNTINGRC